MLLLVFWTGLMAGCHLASGTRGTTAPSPLMESANQPLAVDSTQPSQPVDSTTPRERAAGRVLQTAFAQPGPVPAGTDHLTLEAAIQRALEQNPRLTALRAQESVALAALGVASAYPFAPSASMQIEPTPRDEQGNDLKTAAQYSISQTFQLAGQRGLRTRAGDANLDQTRWQIQRAIVRTAAEARRRYIDAFYQMKQGALYTSLADLNTQLRALIQHRFEAGQSSAADMALARMEAATARQQAAVEVLKGRVALLALKAYLQIDPHQDVTLLESAATNEQLPLPSDMAETDATAGPTALFTQITLEDVPSLVETRPDILAARAAVAQARANYELAKANLVPNVQIGPTFSRDESATEFWGVAATIPFGISHTAAGKPLVRQREAQLRQRRIELEQQRRQARQELKSAVLGYELARDAMEHCDQEALDQLHAEVARVEHLFEAGQVELLRVYAARKAVFQFRLSCLNAELLLAQAITDVQAAAAIVP